ncbi:MAG: molybdate ABC transporter substrate-binding protein [Myxococcota bacterium]|nr:molybdate ABC transporter substrate-binding protein [Myxococcota bacterium]
MWAVSALLLLQGCGEGTRSPPVLTVLAAASLSEVFPELEQAYEQAHSGVDVQVSLAGSQVLATQVRYGISADVFASANVRHVEELIAEGLLENGEVFASNELVLALSDTWEGSLDLKNLVEVGSLVLGTPESPIGSYTERFLERASGVYGDDWLGAVRSRVVSRESNVRLAAAKVILGEADAAIVYATDCLGQEALRCVPVSEELAPKVSYHQARLVQSPAAGPAMAWMEFVESEVGLEVLQRFGFGGPVP